MLLMFQTVGGNTEHFRPIKLVISAAQKQLDAARSAANSGCFSKLIPSSKERISHDNCQRNVTKTVLTNYYKTFS